MESLMDQLTSQLATNMSNRLWKMMLPDYTPTHAQQAAVEKSMLGILKSLRATNPMINPIQGFWAQALTNPGFWIRAPFSEAGLLQSERDRFNQNLDNIIRNSAENKQTLMSMMVGQMPVGMFPQPNFPSPSASPVSASPSTPQQPVQSPTTPTNKPSPAASNLSAATTTKIPPVPHFDSKPQLLQKISPLTKSEKVVIGVRNVPTATKIPTAGGGGGGGSSTQKEKQKKEKENKPVAATNTSRPKRKKRSLSNQITHPDPPIKRAKRDLLIEARKLNASPNEFLCSVCLTVRPDDEQDWWVGPHDSKDEEVVAIGEHFGFRLKYGDFVCVSCSREALSDLEMESENENSENRGNSNPENPQSSPIPQQDRDRKSLSRSVTSPSESLAPPPLQLLRGIGEPGKQKKMENGGAENAEKKPKRSAPTCELCGAHSKGLKRSKHLENKVACERCYLKVKTENLQKFMLRLTDQLHQIQNTSDSESEKEESQKPKKNIWEITFSSHCVSTTTKQFRFFEFCSEQAMRDTILLAFGLDRGQSTSTTVVLRRKRRKMDGPGPIVPFMATIPAGQFVLEILS